MLAYEVISISLNLFWILFSPFSTIGFNLVIVVVVGFDVFDEAGLAHGSTPNQFSILIRYWIKIVCLLF